MHIAERAPASARPEVPHALDANVGRKKVAAGTGDVQP